MSEKVVKLELVNGVGAGRKLSANRVLAAARGKLTDVVIIGTDHDGEIYMASTQGAADTLWDIEYGKQWLLSGGGVGQ